MHFVGNSEEFNVQNKLWCEGGMQLADIETNNSREDGSNTRLGYSMVRLDNL